MRRRADFHPLPPRQRQRDGGCASACCLGGPDRPVEDLKDEDEIYHVLYDINEKFQIPSEVYVNTGRTYEKDGYVPKWRAIRNDRGRIMVAICANMHLGDAWEWADSPEYPEKFSGLAFRIVLNYITYSMTH